MDASWNTSTSKQKKELSFPLFLLVGHNICMMLYSLHSFLFHMQKKKPEKENDLADFSPVFFQGLISLDSVCFSVVFMM